MIVKKTQILLLIFTLVFLQANSYSQFRQVKHRAPESGEIPVKEPGNYGIPGATYVLVNDISSPFSTIFLGKDVTLDMNGYTITYADGNYGHVTNYGFEDGLKGWDISDAPGAKLEKTEDVRPFIGEKFLRLMAGDEIVSSYVYLPFDNRSYFAMCGVAGNLWNEMGGDLSNDMHISIFVEDENGNNVQTTTQYSDSIRVSCPMINRSTRLGGGFIYAHLNNLRAGMYRIRIKAETDCLVDEIDIRPAMDVGIGIVERTHPRGHYDHLHEFFHTAFFDYTANAETGEPIAGLPVVEGRGTVTIKNGTIKNGSVGILSWGIQSTARDVKVIIDNVKMVSSGINTIAVDVPQATITRCKFELDNPFIINRHGAEFYSVDLRGRQPSEVSFSEFYGGQGNLVIKGENSLVHNNYFENHQTVTNHYSIMAMGDGSRIYYNVFKPVIGSGINIFRHKHIEIFNNEFHIKANPPSCEYPLGNSANAIRLADYGAETGSPGGAYGNRIYNNKFYITGMKFEKFPDQVPTVNAFFYSASAGENEVFGNEIIVYQQNPESNAVAYAFYIGNSRLGKFYNNHITTNVTPIWVSCAYGTAEKTLIKGNIIEKAPHAIDDFAPVRMGSRDHRAMGTIFRSNEFRNMDFKIDATNLPHSYSVYWTLDLQTLNRRGKPYGNADITITDRNGVEVVRQQTSGNGKFSIELPEFVVEDGIKTYSSPYTVSYQNRKEKIDLTRNKQKNLIL